MNPQIVVGSRNVLKRNAVLAACLHLGREIEILECDAESGINAQPFGEVETLQGARNRARAAAKQFPQAICIGIENGLVQTAHGYEDIAIIVLRLPDGTERVAKSDAVSFPSDIVEIARQRGFDRHTAGSVLAEQFGSDPADPHRFLTQEKRTRQHILSDALVIVMKNASSFHLSVAGFERDLPVREVAPGVRVALFNLMCDPELTEAAGKALAKLLPTGTQVLLMPEGKALSLLHVVARESGLPCVIARKGRKAYMREPVISVGLRSITTASDQSLYLDADDVAQLASRQVALLDDVVSTGGTLRALAKLMTTIDARVIATLAVLTEGDRREDVITLGHLPLL